MIAPTDDPLWVATGGRHRKGTTMPSTSNLVWIVVGILAAIALIIFIVQNVSIT